MKRVYWLRTDLRILDNEALTTCLQNNQEVIFVFAETKSLKRAGPIRKKFVYDCLTSFYKNDFFDAEIPVEQFFKKYKHKIINLPNITPNGLVLPKLEILSSVNLLNKSVSDLIEFIGIILD